MFPLIVFTQPAATRYILKSGSVVAGQLAKQASQVYRFNEPWMRFQSVTDSFLVLTFSSDADLPPDRPGDHLTRELTYQLDAIGQSDSLYSTQWNIPAIRFDLLTDSDIPVRPVKVAIIDTGLDRDHPELKNQLWVNTAESPISDGTDSDDNGLIDDWSGADFTGKQPDGQPNDDQGHGTAVAGIIAAEQGNGRGIAGLAPHAQLIAIKAFDETGNGSEVTIARALLYAWYRQADVVNMSFGINNEKSLLIESIIRAMANDGILLIASSGNRGGYDRHYPSAYEGVISVGASTIDNFRAIFSQFGNRLDVLAPGVGIPSTSVGGGYGDFSGTSASAPHVSALAAWIKALKPDVTVNSFRTLLQTTTTKTDSRGFTAPDGAGVVNFYRAIFQGITSGMVRINQPESDGWWRENELPVSVSVAGPNFRSWSLFIQPGKGYPEKWTLLTSGTTQILDSVVIKLPASEWAGKDTVLSLRLRMENQTGSAVEDRRFVFLNQKPFDIQDSIFYRTYHGDQPGIGAEIRTSQPVKIDVDVPGGIQPGDTWRHLTVTEVLTHDSGPLTPVFTLRNLAGNDQTFSRRIPSFRMTDWNAWTPKSELELNLPAGFILPETPDFNQDGIPDMIHSMESVTSEYGNISFIDGATLSVADSITGRVLVPKDVVFYNDRWYALFISLGRSFIYQSASATGYPGLPLFESPVSQEMWGGAFEVRDGVLHVHWRDNRTWYRSVVNTSNGTLGEKKAYGFPDNYQLSGPPKVKLVQFSEKGQPDYLVADQYGNLLIFRDTGLTSFSLIWSEPLPLFLSSDYIGAIDLTGDGLDEILALSRDVGITDPVYDESWPGRWNLQIYSYHSGQSERLYDRWFTGYSPGSLDRSGLFTMEVGSDRLIVFSLDPHLYQMKISPGYPLNVSEGFWTDKEPASSAGTWDASTWWTTSNGRLTWWIRDSETIPVITDLIQRTDSTIEVVLDRVYDQVVYQYRKSDGSGSTDSVFHSSSFLLKGTGTGSLAVFSSHKEKRVISGRNQRTLNFYQQGHLNASVQQGLIRLTSSNPMKSMRQVPDDLRLNGHAPDWWIQEQGKRALWLRFPYGLTGKIPVPILKDENNRELMPLPDTLLIPESPTQKPLFYLTGFEVMDRRTATIQFSRPVDVMSVPTILTRNPGILLTPSSPSSLQVESLNQPIGNVGKPLVIDFFGLMSVGGDSLDSRTRFVSLETMGTSVKDLLVYPNPWRSDLSTAITFAGLPAGTTIAVYDITLRHLSDLTVERGTSAVSWDGKTKGGAFIGSGLYLFRATGPDGQEREGKFAVIR